ncbi:MAG: hypothetical protein IV090_08310 [Candidatus Sericytochromatia bacterium]|nr:hypothetical protein [Candidatus Sericytochromatia bacterium]
MIKKTAALVLSTGLLMACNGQPTPVATAPVSTPQTAAINSSPEAQQLVNQLKAQGNQNVSVIDVGQGKKTPAVLSMTVNFKNAEAFKTQASVSGVPSGATLNQLRVFLLESNGAPAPGNITALVKNAGGSLITRAGLGPHTFVFANVPANAATMKYYVGVSPLLNVPTGPPTAPYTLNLLATPNTHNHGALGLVALSTTGGEGAGEVHVDANYQVSNPAVLGIAMTLRNETGASIDSQATITNGSTGIPVISVS